MKYFISKPKSHKPDTRIADGIHRMDTGAVIVHDLCDADVVVFQTGWSRSKACMADYQTAKNNHIRIQEGYLYSDKQKAHLN